jgi:hypothetical protein
MIFNSLNLNIKTAAALCRQKKAGENNPGGAKLPGCNGGRGTHSTIPFKKHSALEVF